MEIVGTETRKAMKLCKKAQVEEHVVIHVVRGSTNFYTRLQFFLLASTWFPRPIGVCLWSVLHVLLVLYEALMLLVVFSTVFTAGVVVDAINVAHLISMVLLLPLLVIIYFLYLGIACLWLVITCERACECCTMPPRAPGQTLVQYICSGGGTVPDGPQYPHPALCAFLKELPKCSLTLFGVEHVTSVSFPHRRAQLRDSYREIVPWYDNVVM